MDADVRVLAAFSLGLRLTQGLGGSDQNTIPVGWDLLPLLEPIANGEITLIDSVAELSQKHPEVSPEAIAKAVRQMGERDRSIATDLVRILRATT